MLEGNNRVPGASSLLGGTNWREGVCPQDNLHENRERLHSQPRCPPREQVSQAAAVNHWAAVRQGRPPLHATVSLSAADGGTDTAQGVTSGWGLN